MSIIQSISNSPINLHQLRVLATVVETESFTRAAIQLSLSQPAVSAQINQLRNLVGLPLVVREGRRVVPTEAGRILYRYAREVLTTTDAVARNLAEVASGEMDHIVVGANRSYSSILLPPVLTRFGLARPDLQVSVVQAVGEDLVNLVRSGKVDLGITGGGRTPEALFAASLGTDELVVLEASDAPFSSGRILTPAEVASLPFLRTSISGAHLTAGMDALLAQHGLPPPRVALDLPTWQGIREAAVAGLGLAVLYRSVVRQELARGELRMVEVAGYRDVREVCLICAPQRRRAEAPVFTELRETIHQELHQAFSSAALAAPISSPRPRASRTRRGGALQEAAEALGENVANGRSEAAPQLEARPSTGAQPLPVLADPQSWVLPDDVWRAMEPLIPGRQRPEGRPRTVDLKRVTEGIFYVLRTGIRWQALPREHFGPPSTVYYYYRRWVASGVFRDLRIQASRVYGELPEVGRHLVRV